MVVVVVVVVAPPLVRWAGEADRERLRRPSAGSQRDLLCTEQYHTVQLHIAEHDQIDRVDNSIEGFSQMLVSSEETPPSTNEVVSYFIHTSFILSITILSTGEWKVNRETT